MLGEIRRSSAFRKLQAQNESGAFPAVMQQSTLRIEDDGEGEWHRPIARVALEKARIGVFNEPSVADGHETAYRKACEPEVCLHWLKPRSFFSETVGGRVWNKSKIWRVRVAKRETGLINAAGRQNHAIPIEERRRERQGAESLDGKALGRRECADARDGDLMRDAARNDIRAGDIKTGAAPTGTRDAATPVIEHGKKNSAAKSAEATTMVQIENGNSAVRASDRAPTARIVQKPHILAARLIAVSLR